jgi:CRP-like cAMP-binding protein
MHILALTGAGMSKTELADNALQNELLKLLPETEFKKIRPLLEEVDLKLDEVLWEMEEQRKYVYFPTTALICMLYDTDEGMSIEVGMTGKKGMVGVVTFIGDCRMSKRAVVEYAGQAYRAKAQDVEQLFAHSQVFQKMCLSYTQALIAHVSQNVICNRLHTVQQQLCRYLLVWQDNLTTDTFPMTHEQISKVLGVRRESVTFSASQLRDKGFISYMRGEITIIDRKALLAEACECYEAVNQQYERIFCNLYD